MVITPPRTPLSWSGHGACPVLRVDDNRRGLASCLPPWSNRWERARRSDEWLEGLPCWAREESLDDEAAVCKGHRAESCGLSGSQDLAFFVEQFGGLSRARVGISCSILAAPGDHDPRDLLGSVRGAWAVRYRTAPIHTDIMFNFEEIFAGTSTRSQDRGTAPGQALPDQEQRVGERARVRVYRSLAGGARARRHLLRAGSCLPRSRVCERLRARPSLLREQFEIALGFVQRDHNRPTLLGCPLTA
jgi:hypothetical protein